MSLLHFFSTQIVLSLFDTTFTQIVVSLWLLDTIFTQIVMLLFYTVLDYFDT